VFAHCRRHVFTTPSPSNGRTCTSHYSGFSAVSSLIFSNEWEFGCCKPACELIILIEQAWLLEFATVGSPTQPARFVEFQWKVGLSTAFTGLSLVPPACGTAHFHISHKGFKNFTSKCCVASYDTANNVRECKRHMSLKASASLRPTSSSMVSSTFKNEVLTTEPRHSDYYSFIWCKEKRHNQRVG
jgi:hypothetical protein